MSAFFGLLKVVGLFRVDPKDEEDGLDNSYHGGSAYGDSVAVSEPLYLRVRRSAENTSPLREGRAARCALDVRQSLDTVL